jgi:glycosyltransferase involved in cell wall biosynthesis
MGICFFGTYALAEGYPINRVLIQGLRQAGARVEECREELWEGFLHQVLRRTGWQYLGLGLKALRAYGRLVRRYWRTGAHQVVVVGYPGYGEIVLARLLNLCSGRRLVLVSFISLYDTLVLDRGQVGASSWKARVLYWIDCLAFGCADQVLVDTREVALYFSRLFAVPQERFQRSFVGNVFEEYEPGPVPATRSNSFRVLFFGTYVPLHGVEHILEAAEILQGDRQVEFTLVGNGQLYAQMRRQAAAVGLDRVGFVDQWVSTGELAEYMRRADACLGIFGTTAKAGRVIPYKVFGALALRRPVITRDSPAIRELLTDGESALLCAPGSGSSLAQAIQRLRSDARLAARLAQEGYARYQAQGSARAIGRALLEHLEERGGG